MASFLTAIIVSLLAQSNPAPTTVVVELFTSEGCSSCPPADRVLDRLSRDHSLNLIVLGQHVDYWDRLGWKDRFSSPAFTERQLAYASVLRVPSAYTPQLVVQGRYQLIGSDERGARHAIEQAQTRNPVTALDLSAKLDEDQAAVIVELSTMPTQGLCTLFLVEPSSSTDVRTGENAGRRLAHVAIARTLTTIRLKHATASVRIPIPAGSDAAKVVAVLQDRQGGPILAAGQTEFAVKNPQKNAQ